MEFTLFIRNYSHLGVLVSLISFSDYGVALENLFEEEDNFFSLGDS